MLSIFLCCFSCLFTFLFNPIGKSHRKLQVLKDSSTFKFCQDLPSTERFYPILRQNLNQKLIRAKKKNVVGGFGFLGFFLVRGLIWIFSRKLFLFHPLWTYICRVLTYFAKNLELEKLEPAAFSNQKEFNSFLKRRLSRGIYLMTLLDFSKRLF